MSWIDYNYLLLVLLYGFFLDNIQGFQVKKRKDSMVYDVTHKAGLLDKNNIRKVLSISEQYKRKAGSSKAKTAEENEGSSKGKTAEEKEGSSMESDADENEAEGIDENEREED